MANKGQNPENNSYLMAQRLEREVLQISRRDGRKGAKKKAASNLKIKPAMASKYLSILKYDDSVQQFFKEGFLKVFHVQYLNKADASQQYELALALRSGLNVSKVDEFLSVGSEGVVNEEVVEHPPLDRDIRNLLELLEENYGVSFKVEDGEVFGGGKEFVLVGCDLELLKDLIVVQPLLSEGLDVSIRTFSKESHYRAFEIRLPYTKSHFMPHLNALVKSFKLVKKLREIRDKQRQ